MPKKPPKNSYFYFMLDFKNREAKKGRNLTLPQAAQEASSEWSQMDPEERRLYEIRAKEGKNETIVKKYTTLGQDIDQLTKKEKEEADSIAAMHQDIEKIVIGSPDPPELEFYVGYVNYYCFCTSLNKYFPAEISIVRFSLNTGVDFNDIFHVILDTGNLPIGYRLVALKQSEDTHGIPPPPHENNDMKEISESNMRKVLQSMLDFLGKNSTSKDSLPPVYFEPTNMPIAKDVLKTLILDYGNNSTPDVKVYSLLHLFYQLRTYSKKDIFPITIAQAEFERDIYDYVQGISCEYHSVSDQYNFCSLSHAIRKIFLVCDYTNPSFGIQLVAGKHVPKNACTERLINNDVLQEEAAALPFKAEPPNSSETNKTEVPKKLRLPISKSFAETYRESKVPSSQNYKSDIPTLGGDERPRPAAIGRGRGRILQNK